MHVLTSFQGPNRSHLVDPAFGLSPDSHSITSGSKPINDHEVAFLLRHFSETTGQWYVYKQIS